MDIEKLVSHPELPSIPEALLKLNKLIRQEAPIEKLTAVITHEPALTARTLELANSAWYKRQREIATVHDAIAVIGVTTLHRLIFASSVIRTFAGVKNSLIDMDRYWHQSIRTAAAAQILAHVSNTDDPLDLFTAGVLLYIGKLILYIAAPELSQQILAASQARQQPHFIVENEILGYNHGNVTAALLKRWSLPTRMHASINIYTDPEKSPSKYRNRACTLNIAHHLQYVHNLDIAVTDPPGPLNTFALGKLRISETELTEYSAILELQYKEALTLLGM